jgi:AraC-like DNA-binding protein
MSQKPADGSVFRLSTWDLLEKDRVEFWCEEFGRSVVKIDIELISDIPLACSATVRNLPGLSIITHLSSGYRMARTSGLIADGNDDFILSIMSEGCGYATQVGRDATAGWGDGVLLSSSNVGTVTFPEAVKIISLTIPRATLRTLVADPEAALVKTIPKENEALRLLRGYLSTFDEQMNSGLEPPLSHVFAGHVQDLTALALGATRDGAELAKGQGLRAARLCAMKTEIMHNLTRGDLSVSFIAARHGVTPRYVQMLFEIDGVTFSEFVLAQRLALAFRKLADPRFANRTISDIVFEAGFGDSSHFNRAFRRRYGATPSEVRSVALRGGGEPL